MSLAISLDPYHGFDIEIDWILKGIVDLRFACHGRGQRPSRGSSWSLINVTDFPIGIRQEVWVYTDCLRETILMS